MDEGPRDAPPVVMVHGNPTWGYLYRNFIPPLVEAGYRVIVPDLLVPGAPTSRTGRRSTRSGVMPNGRNGCVSRSTSGMPRWCPTTGE